LKSLARASKGQRMAASAYLGSGASKLLPLRRGDILLCALSLANCRAGNVNPSEIRLLMEKKVKVYAQADLHAKVYLFGDAGIVCSANMSSNSVQRLDEAGIVVRGRIVVEIRRWFLQRLGEPVQPLFLDECEKVYRPPRFAGGIPQGQKKGRGHRDADDLDRVWIVQAEGSVYPESEASAMKAGGNTARRVLEHPRLNDVYTVRWDKDDLFARVAIRGDTLVEVQTSSSGTEVLPHGKILHRRAVPTRRGGLAHYFYFEVPRKFRKLTAKAFRRSCEKAGSDVLLNREVRLVRDRMEKLVVRTVTSPDARRVRPRRR
jgi:hypothetical protein